MKRISVLLVLVLTLFSLAALTSCGCQASSDTKPSGQTSTPGNTTNNGTTNNGTTNNGTANNGSTSNGTPSNGTPHNGTNSGVTTPAPGNGSLADDMINGGESIIDGVIEGGQDIVDGVGDAITGNTDNNTNHGNSSNLPTYEDMVRNGRIR